MNIWQKVTALPGSNLEWQVGPLTCRLKRDGDEWLFAPILGAETDQVRELQAVPEDTDAVWTRWVVHSEDNTVGFTPAMPDRPIVVRPEMPVRLPAGEQALFFISIPVWVRVAVGAQPEVVLLDQPTAILSNTWFGNPVDGELCYSLSSTARRTMEGAAVRPHTAVCPVTVMNKDHTELSVQRICIRTDYLAVFSTASRLWTNDVTIAFRGSDRESAVDYSKNAPTYEPVTGRLNESRKTVTGNIFRKSFSSVLTYAGF